MPQADSSRANPKRKRKLASRGSKSRAKDARKREVMPTVETSPPLLPPVGRLERTRRLILAALRVWELKRRIRD